MREILAALLVLLTACAPLVQVAQPAERATLTRAGLSVTLTNPGPDALTGDPSRAGDGVALTVQGAGLVPDAQAAQWCRAATSTSWACTLPDVPAGQRLEVTFTAGTLLDAAVFTYRPSLGARPVILWMLP
ncbi:hypothetical protein [Deinococcus soli (ex Cha et al. 2016)]|uniref:hypothetical protein n=1 Tax=Deinococcus soli (ex Cha et al. 2016) TaxID=1309411 RepID=UPI00166B7F62|nr:hypothetical protein [Deinococcus soli (ex Cha et al. 2016)]GGB62510.1 hypothetical protein GCM10008019_18080 [Deinococcus soli (ex Cha et al. 2016)]